MAATLLGARPDLSSTLAPETARASRPTETTEQRQRRKEAESRKQEHTRRQKDKLKQKQAAAAAVAAKKPKAAARSAESQHFTRQTPFVCNIRFRNDLPEIPCDPKMLVNPLQPEQLAEFKLTRMELESRHEMPVPMDLGIPISALDIQKYAVPDEPEPLDPADELLLQGDAEEVQGEQGQKGARTRGKAAPVNLPWLMNTTYIQGGAQQARGGAALKKLQELQAAEGAQLDERDSQIAEIEESFEAAARPPIHQTDPNLTPLEVLPVFPDDELADQKSVVIQFDGDPAADDPRLSQLTSDERLRLTEHSIVKSYNLQDDATGKFVAFMTPSDPGFICEGAPAEEREAFGNAAEVDYKWVREFSFDVRHGKDGQYEYVFHFTRTGVFYTVLGAKLTLRKRSKHKGAFQEISRPSKITLKRRRDDNEEQPADLPDEQQTEETSRPAVRQRTGLSSSDEEDQDQDA